MRSHRAAGLAALLSSLSPALSGCSDDAVPTPGGPSGGQVVRIIEGDFAVTADTAASTVVLERGGEVLLELGADSFQLGVVPAVDDETNYDPYRLYVEHPLYVPLDDLRWLDARAMAVLASDGSRMEIGLDYGEARATLRIELGALATAGARPGSFRAELVPEAAAAPQVAFFRLRPRADGSEGFYGLGEYFDDVDNRGHVRAMQIEVDGGLESSYNEAHVPVPFVTGTRGWGLFVDSPYPGAFAVATGDDHTIEAAFGTGTASGAGLRFHLFAAEHALDVTRHYYDVTGYPRLPAPWALGPWVWRDENDDQAQVESDLQTIRDLDLATTAYWIDRPYATAVHTFDYDPAKFVDPAAMMEVFESLGFETALWHTPYLDEMDQATDTAALRAVAEAEGYYPPDVGVLLNGWGRPIDPTNPDAVAWWQGLVSYYRQMGVSGFKLDYGEDVVLGLVNLREPWLFADGSDERTMHAQFQLAYHRLYAELLPEDGGFLLCRGGTYGDQVNVNVVWPGDLDATFGKHREEMTEPGGETYVGVGGLPASIVAGLSLGPSGFPFYGADTGGYKHSPPDKELFTRWFQQTALSTVMQIGTSSNDVAWEPTAENGFDAEMLDLYRVYTRLHLRLLPYLWTHAQRLAVDGRPIQRALGLAEPSLGVHPNDVYLLGDALLVAPVVERGARTRTFPLPARRWADWWTGEVHAGSGAEITTPAPLDTLPLLLVEGGIVPLLRPTIDTLSPVSAPDIDSFADGAGVLSVRVFPGAPGAFTVYDGTELEAEADATTMRLSARAGSVFAEGVLFEAIASGAAPLGVSASGRALAEVALEALSEVDSGWAWEEATGGTLWVKVGPGDHEVVVTR